MKKRLFVLILAIMLIFTGCQEEEKKEFNLNNAKSIIEENISELRDISEDTLVDVYDLDLSNIDEFVFKQNDSGDFYAIIKAKDLSKVKNNMKDYFEKVEKFNTNYSPERLELLKNRVEKEIDSYLIYIISEDANSIYEKIINEM